jgi:hypothetical protein
MKTVKDSHEKQRAIRMNTCVAQFISHEQRFRNRQSHNMGEEVHTGQNFNLSSSTGPATPNVSRHPSGVEPNSPTCMDSPITGPEIPSGAKSYQGLGLHSTHVTPSLEEASHVADLPMESVESRGRSHHREASQGSLSVSPSRPSATEAGQQSVFDRAACLLREALDLETDRGGGVVLFDTNALADNAETCLRRHGSDFGDGSGTRMELPRQHSSESVTGTGVGAARSVYSGPVRERVVLAAASINRAEGRPPANFGRADTTFQVTLTPPELQRLCQRYSRGRLFNIPDNTGTSLFDWEGRHVSCAFSAKLGELVLLRRQFPDANQVIFVPIFHPSFNRWTSCFAFTNSRYRVFSHQMDYLPMLSFCSVVKAEMSRLGTAVVDEEKGNFIGSVSHELRSPLHGILASIEFLQGTNCDAFQRYSPFLRQTLTHLTHALGLVWTLWTLVPTLC